MTTTPNKMMDVIATMMTTVHTLVSGAVVGGGGMPGPISMSA